MEKTQILTSQKDEIIEYHLRFQNLLISISTQYINADLSNIDKLINSSLAQVGKAMGVDRSYIFNYDLEQNTATNTYEWCKEGILPTIDENQNVSLEHMDYLMDIHKRGEAFVVNDVNELPDKGGEAGLKSILISQDIKSMIIIPKIRNNELSGFVGFDSVEHYHKYTEQEKDILRVFANMLINIRQRKEQEELIKKQEAKKEELLISLSVQNEKLNDYAQIVSHDLKAPLINIHNMVDWFITDNKTKLDEATLQPLKEVLFNVEKMDVLIKGILEYSLANRKNVVYEEVDLNDVLDDILRVVPVPSTITIDIQGSLPKINGNRFKFQQLFQNLIQNAIKFNNKPNGKITIGCKNVNTYYQFFVKDNGVGIKPEYYSKIFKAFTKLDSTTASSGIGLSIVKRIVEFYKGDIWVESKENEFTAFNFTIKDI